MNLLFLFFAATCTSPVVHATTPQPVEKTLRLRHVLHHGTTAFSRPFRRLDFDATESPRLTGSSSAFGPMVFDTEDPDRDLRAEEERLGAPLRYVLKYTTSTENATEEMFEAWRDRPWVREQFFEDLLVGAKAGSWVRRVKEYHHHPHSEKLGVQDDGEGVWSVREEERRRRRRPREPFRLLPDLKDPKTVLALGKMSFNSYYDPGKSEWKDINDWDVENRFGWESDGIRGYLFADEEREVVILAIKGTTPLWPGVGGGPTGPRDKMNDNTYFSCCCAKVSWSWKTVCDCANSVNECRADCIHPAVSFVDSYYNLAQTFFLAIRDWYPNSHVWLTGHSLGGALAALVALTNNLAAIAYESPGDLLYAHRLGLLPSTAFSEHSSELAIPDYSDYLSKLPIYHVGNVHDPIYHGKCNGPTSTCWYGGYVLETRCHIGKECIYDEGGTPRLDIRLHGIQLVIQEYLEKWETVPDCEVMRGCEDCGAWKFV